MTDKALFRDGKRKIDYVFIYSTKIIGTESENKVTKYINNIEKNGLQTEREQGAVLKEYTCVKIHAPEKVLKEFAEVFKIDLTKDNPYYKNQKTHFKFVSNILTTPNENHFVFKRAPETLSGKKPETYTDAERIYIVYRILSAVQFGPSPDDKGFQLLIQENFIIDAYPLHDSSYEWTEEGPLSDRQLLARYWANLRCFYCYQPLNLIERYYGAEVGFYFAWIGFYTQTLIVASFTSLVCFIIGLILYEYDTNYIKDEVCNSNQLICPVCPSEEWCSFNSIKFHCTMMKIAYVLENPVTLVYSIFMSFWGIIFMVLWKRKEAMLRMRWNVSEVPRERSVRAAFIQAAKIQRVSSITGETEYYFSFAQKTISHIVSVFVFLIMFLAYTLGVVIIMQYRLNVLYYGNRSTNSMYRENLELFESVTSSFLTYLIMTFFNSIRNTLSRKLTEWENPRTQNELEARYFMKVIILTFGNIFFPIIYLAYFKGKFFSHPGDITQWTLLGLFKVDVCPLSGCLVNLSMQLFIIMGINNLQRLFWEILIPYIRVYIRRRAPKDPNISISRWEEDYALVKPEKHFLYNEYIEMVLQYAFMTFFVVALPIAPILAFLNNILEIRFDGMKLLKKSRRIIPKYNSGIETWNTVMLVITILGCISNPLLIAYSSNLVPRYLYRRHYGNLTGYVNSTLSEFSVKDFPRNMAKSNREIVDTCHYQGHRYPPTHPQKYELTLDFWHQIAIQSVVFIVLENVCLLFSLLLKNVIPPLPRKVEIKMQYEQELLRKSRLKNKLVK
ncbi:anoctamin-6 [Leptinotarsa decemlineata]|uniref:anoctamin-6 n=1 Tax=Leptinotarsa decemlineata TaxID=7539 RepID=UPI003D3064F1